MIENMINIKFLLHPSYSPKKPWEVPVSYVLCAKWNRLFKFNEAFEENSSYQNKVCTEKTNQGFPKSVILFSMLTKSDLNSKIALL